MSLLDLHLQHQFPSVPDLCPYCKDDGLHPLFPPSFNNDNNTFQLNRFKENY